MRGNFCLAQHQMAGLRRSGVSLLHVMLTEWSVERTATRTRSLQIFHIEHLRQEGSTVVSVRVQTIPTQVDVLPTFVSASTTKHAAA